MEGRDGDERGRKELKKEHYIRGVDMSWKIGGGGA